MKTFQIWNLWHWRISKYFYYSLKCFSTMQTFKLKSPTMSFQLPIKKSGLSCCKFPKLWISNFFKFYISEGCDINGKRKWSFDWYCLSANEWSMCHKLFASILTDSSPQNMLATGNIALMDDTSYHIPTFVDHILTASKINKHYKNI